MFATSKHHISTPPVTIHWHKRWTEVSAARRYDNMHLDFLFTKEQPFHHWAINRFISIVTGLCAGEITIAAASEFFIYRRWSAYGLEDAWSTARLSYATWVRSWGAENSEEQSLVSCQWATHQQKLPLFTGSRCSIRLIPHLRNDYPSAAWSFMPWKIRKNMGNNSHSQFFDVESKYWAINE